jgi:hypothetical protein
MPNGQQKPQGDAPQTNITEETLKGLFKSVSTSAGKNVGEHVFGKEGLLGKLLDPILGEGPRTRGEEHEEKMQGEREAFTELEQQQHKLRDIYDSHVAGGNPLTPEMRQQGQQMGIAPQLLDAYDVIAADRKKGATTLEQLHKSGLIDDKTFGMMSAVMSTNDPRLTSLATEMLKMNAYVANLQADLAVQPKIKGAEEEAKQSVLDVHEPKRRGEIAAAEAPYKSHSDTAQQKQELETRTRKMGVTNAVGQANENIPLVKGKDFDPDASVDNVYRANTNSFASPSWTPESVPQDAGFATKDSDGKAIAGTGFEGFLHKYAEKHPDEMPPETATQTATQLSAAWEAGNVSMFKRALSTLPTSLRTAIERVQRDAFAHSQERAKRAAQKGGPSAANAGGGL